MRWKILCNMINVPNYISASMSLARSHFKKVMALCFFVDVRCLTCVFIIGYVYLWEIDNNV